MDWDKLQEYADGAYKSFRWLTGIDDDEENDDYDNDTDDDDDDNNNNSSWKRGGKEFGVRENIGIVGDDEREVGGMEEEFDYEYPVPENTMVMPEGVPNPYSKPGRGFYVDAGATEGSFKVRGLDYLDGGKKRKIPCGIARMKISAVEWSYHPEQPIEGISQQEGGYIQTQQANRVDRPFMLVLNFMVPKVGNFVMYLTRRTEIRDPVFDQMLEEYMEMEDGSPEKNSRFKIIPGVLNGAKAVRYMVGNKPALISNKLTTTWFRGSNYYEICINVGSSSVGTSIWSSVKSFANGLTLHLGFLLESKSKEELPERLLAAVDLYNPVIKPNMKLYEKRLKLIQEGKIDEDVDEEQT